MTTSLPQAATTELVERSTRSMRPVVASWLPLAALALGTVAAAGQTAFSVVRPSELPYLVSTLAFLVTSIFVYLRRPDHPLRDWLAVMAGFAAVTQSLDLVLAGLGEADASAWALASANVGTQTSAVISAIGSVYLLALFADGEVQRRYEHWFLSATWWLLLIPPLLLVVVPVVTIPWYHSTAPVSSPLYSPAVGIGEDFGRFLGEQAAPAAFIVGVVLLLLRYRRAEADARAIMRWLLLPVVVAAVFITTNLLFRGPTALFAWLYAGTMVAFALSIGMAILQPGGINADRLLRQSLVYGFLWVMIAVAYVGAGAAVGVAAGQRLSIGWSVTLAVLAAVSFQPARGRLERLADRWVFGSRVDPDRLVGRLGETLAGTYDLETLMPRMTATLEEGLGLRWARTVLEPRATEDLETAEAMRPALIVPIELDGEQLGVIECGPKVSGQLSAEEVAVVSTFARQAAFAVRNVRLTRELAAQAERLTRSRRRIVQAQEAERRRIERNIHDGVQQDLVALIGKLGRTLHSNAGVPPATAELESIQGGLQRLLSELRELAQGISPSVVRDHGLLVAVEHLAARHPIRAVVHADASLRGKRLDEEVEGAGYFTVAESLANSLKHALAERVDVSIARSETSLRIRVTDDGVGFDPTEIDGGGLGNLAERLAAIGGQLQVTSARDEGTTVTAEFVLAPGGQSHE